MFVLNLTLTHNSLFPPRPVDPDGPAGIRPGDLPVDGARPPEVPAHHASAAALHDGGNPRTPRPVHQPRHEPQVVPGALSQPGPRSVERQGVPRDADVGADLRAAAESRGGARNDVPATSGRRVADGDRSEVAAF